MHLVSLGLRLTATFGVLLMAACPDASDPAATRADASTPPAADAGSDAAASSCPASEPMPGSACAGELRCRLQRHGDCAAPRCPAGCTFLGLKPGVSVTGGVAYYAVCRDGSWQTVTEGDCSANQAAVRCECPDRDAGVP